MKRKHKNVQQILDDTLLAAIQSGESDNTRLKQIFRTTLSDHLTQTGNITVAYLLDVLCGSELSNSKQRLRSCGQIEITKGNQPKTADTLTSDDVEFIDQRRRRHIAGELKTCVEFNLKHKRPESVAIAYQQLALFSLDDVDRAEVEVELKAELQ